jgi:hypothetical protein
VFGGRVAGPVPSRLPPPPPSWPDLIRPSTPPSPCCQRLRHTTDVDGRDKPGHDGGGVACPWTSRARIAPARSKQSPMIHRPRALPPESVKEPVPRCPEGVERRKAPVVSPADCSAAGLFCHRDPLAFRRSTRRRLRSAGPRFRERGGRRGRREGVLPRAMGHLYPRRLPPPVHLARPADFSAGPPSGARRLPKASRVVVA